MDIYLIIEKAGIAQGDHKIIGITLDENRAKAMGKIASRIIIKLKGEMLNEYMG